MPPPPEVIAAKNPYCLNVFLSEKSLSSKVQTNYNLDGNMEGLLNIIYWECDCCQNSFQRIEPAIYEKNVFTDGGQNVMVKRNDEEHARKVPLCNRCVMLYYHKGWLVMRGKRK